MQRIKTLKIRNKCSSMYRLTSWLVVLGLVLFYAPAIAQSDPSQKLNVIVIMTDDQGTIDMNACGADYLHTPHMDKLAKSGVRFTQFYAAWASCTPSRAALLTGRYPPEG